MGCDMSKMKEKEKAREDKKKEERQKKKEAHHHKKEDAAAAEKQPEEAAPAAPAPPAQQEPAESTPRAATPPPAGAAAAATPSHHEDEPRESNHPDGDDAEAPLDNVAAAEQQQRADIERDAYTAQEAIDRDHIEKEADTTSPLVQPEVQLQESKSIKESVSSRTVKRRPESGSTPRQPPAHPSRAAEVDRKIPTSATVFSKNGEQVDVDAEEAAFAQQQQENMVVSNVRTGELIEHPTKDTPTWKVMKPPQQDGSSWRVLRQVRMVFQLRNVSAI